MIQASLFDARTTDPETSHIAGATDRLTDRERALAILRRYPAGLTDHELADLMGRIQTSAGKRRHELMRDGLVENSGLRRLSPSGSPAIVWRAVATHLLAVAGDDKSLCGIKGPLPRCLARFKVAHDEGHARNGKPAPHWCAECVTVAEQRALL